MNALQDIIESTKVAIKDAEVFVLKYGAKLPDGLGDLYVTNYGATFSVYLNGRNEAQRNRALTYLGDVLGRDGWTASLEHGGRAFSWTKTDENVRIKIEGAQPLSQPDSFPVEPKQFPIQLEDAQPA